MSFEILRDSKGKPSHVNIDDGFMMTSRPYDEDTDGWMDHQLSPHDFSAISFGREVEWLVAEVNRLRRENFSLERQLELLRR